MSLVLDASALVAVERAHRDTVALIKQEVGRCMLTTGRRFSESGCSEK